MRKIGQSAHPQPHPQPHPPPPPPPVHQPIQPIHPHYAPHHHYEEPYKPDYYEPKQEYYEPKQDYYEPKPIPYSQHPPFPQYNSLNNYYDDPAFNFPTSVENIPSIPLYSSYEQQQPHLDEDYGNGFRDYNNYYEKRSTNDQQNSKKIAKSPVTATKSPTVQPANTPETNSQSNLLSKMLQHQRHLQLQQLHHDQNNVLLPASTQAL